MSASQSNHKVYDDPIQHFLPENQPLQLDGSFEGRHGAELSSGHLYPKEQQYYDGYAPAFRHSHRGSTHSAARPNGISRYDISIERQHHNGRHQEHQAPHVRDQASAGYYRQTERMLQEPPSISVRPSGTSFQRSKDSVPHKHGKRNCSSYDYDRQAWVKAPLCSEPWAKTGSGTIQRQPEQSHSSERTPRLILKLKRKDPERVDRYEEPQPPRMSSSGFVDLTEDGEDSPYEKYDSSPDQHAPTASTIDSEPYIASMEPPHLSQKSAESDDGGNESDTAKINWKLPEYEAIYFVDAEGWSVAKISVPGMVRNELQLNMEVPELEFKLFDSVFIPLHKQTYPPPTMDPEPKHSVLNFHIIANIFISVFRTIEEETQTPAQHADSDEVFFSAIDKWRVGRALERREYGMIRGIHEFCDIGLEVLAWLKEDGIGQVRQRRERSDKGTKRGPRGSKKGAGTAKKGAAVGKKVNTLSARRHTKKGAPNKVKSGRVTKK